MALYHGNILIIDNNSTFLEKIRKEDNYQLSHPHIIVKTFPEGESLLKNNKHQVRGIFLSSSVGSTHGLSELKQIRQHRPQIPVYLISHRPEQEPVEVRSPETGFSGIIESPQSFSPLAKELDNIFGKIAWNDVEASAEEKNVELKLAEDAYIPNPISDYIITPKSFFNVYIKIGASTFVKILNAGDTIQTDLVESYLKKGLKYFFISADEHQKYIKMCEEMGQRIIRRSDISLSQKVQNVLKLGATISQNIKHTGINEEKLDFANSFLNQTVTLIRSIRMQNKSLKSFLDSLELKEHPSSVSFLAGIIANEVGFESTKSVKLVGIAAMVHDIGLYDLDPDFPHERVNLLTEEQLTIFDKHEIRGGEILRSNGGFEEVICQAVEQHHKRRRGSDPARRTNNINLVTEIIGVADELHNLLSAPDFTPQNYKYFIDITLTTFSPQIEKAVTRLLKQKMDEN
jgi:HD-GYP domain-containing protein (c-di-GMP phosphodiesterase class II)